MRIVDEILRRDGSGDFLAFYSEEDRRIVIPGVGVITYDDENMQLVMRDQDGAPRRYSGVTVDIHRCEHLRRGGGVGVAFYLGNGKFVCHQCALKRGVKVGRVPDLHYIVDPGTRRLRAGSRSWGIEIEVAHIGGKVRYNGYHERAFASAPFIYDWRAEYDRSIEGVEGVELISPVFDDYRVALPQVHNVLETVHALEGVATRECGTHVHVHVGLGATTIRDKIAQHEEGLFAISSTFWRYAEGRYSPPAKSERIRGHYIAFHVTRYGTIEWRMFPGSTTFARQLMNIALARGFTQLMRNSGKVAKYDKWHRYNSVTGSDGIGVDSSGVIIYNDKAKLADVAYEVAMRVLDELGWREGGSWKGWPIKLTDRKVEVPYRYWTGSEIEEASYTIPSQGEVIENIEKNIRKFVKDAGKKKIVEVVGSV